MPALLARLRAARVGLLCHAASVDRQLRHAGQVLAAVGVRPALLFAPEHGIAACAQDMAAIDDSVDRASGARVVSLYGDSLADLSPADKHLRAIDVLVIDLQDVGARYYTFVWTALIAARAAARAGVHVVLLDRPNPLGGEIAGRTQEPGYTSLVGWERVPIRHGLTLAELLCRSLAHDGLPLGPSGAVSVVPLAGWDRGAGAWDRPWVPPSPNMPTRETALVYPGGCLLEGTNLSEGRGTTRPFEICGAPFLDGAALARDLEKTGLPGFIARPVELVPTFHKHAGALCSGVQIHPTGASFDAIACYVALIALAARQPSAQGRFRFRTDRYEFVSDIPAFDLLTGSPWARGAILAGEEPRAIAEHLAHADPRWPEQQRLAQGLVAQAAWPAG